MKHLLNNMSEEEKNSIREQHTDKLKVNTGNFSKLLNSKLGNVKPILGEQVDESAFTFGDKVKNKLEKIVGVPEITDDEKRLANDILTAVENGDYDVLKKFNYNVEGYEIKVPLSDGDYSVTAKIEYGYTNEYSVFITTPDGEQVDIWAKGFTKKLVNLIEKQQRLKYPKD